MNGFQFTRIIVVTVVLIAGTAEAGYFGSVESGFSSFKNVQAVANEPQAVSGSSFYTAGNVVAFHAFGKASTAALVKMSARHERFADNELLTNNILGGDLGLYHIFSGGDSLMLTAGGRSVSFEDQRRDDTIASGRLAYTHQFSPRLKLSAEALYEQGSEETLNGLYLGMGAATSFNWQVHRVAQLMLGVGYVGNAFEQPADLANGKAHALTLKEQSTTAWVGLALALSKRFYCVTSVAARQVSSDQAEDVSGESYSVALGTRF